MNNIKVHPKVEELYDVIDFVNNEIPIEDMNLNLIVEEVFVNIAQYSQSTYIIIKTLVNDGNEKILIEFIDDGIEFNPLENNNPKLADTIEDTEIGGLGIYLVKNLADKIEYEYINGENHLKITKNVKK